MSILRKEAQLGGSSWLLRVSTTFITTHSLDFGTFSRSCYFSMTSLNNFAKSERECERETPVKIFFMYAFPLLSPMKTPSEHESVRISYMWTELKCYFLMSDFFLSFYILQEFGGYITVGLPPGLWTWFLLFSLLPSIPQLVQTHSQILICDIYLTLLTTFEFRFWILSFAPFSVASHFCLANCSWRLTACWMSCRIQVLKLIPHWSNNAWGCGDSGVWFNEGSHCYEWGRACSLWRAQPQVTTLNEERWSSIRHSTFQNLLSPVLRTVKNKFLFFINYPGTDTGCWFLLLFLLF